MLAVAKKLLFGKDADGKVSYALDMIGSRKINIIIENSAVLEVPLQPNDGTVIFTGEAGALFILSDNATAPIITSVTVGGSPQIVPPTELLMAPAAVSIGNWYGAGKTSLFLTSLSAAQFHITVSIYGK